MCLLKNVNCLYSLKNYLFYLLLSMLIRIFAAHLWLMPQSMVKYENDLQNYKSLLLANKMKKITCFMSMLAIAVVLTAGFTACTNEENNDETSIILPPVYHVNSSDQTGNSYETQAGEQRIDNIDEKIADGLPIDVGEESER